MGVKQREVTGRWLNNICVGSRKVWRRWVLRVCVCVCAYIQYAYKHMLSLDVLFLKLVTELSLFGAEIYVCVIPLHFDSSVWRCCQLVRPLLSQSWLVLSVNYWTSWKERQTEREREREKERNVLEHVDTNKYKSYLDVCTGCTFSCLRSAAVAYITLCKWTVAFFFFPHVSTACFQHTCKHRYCPKCPHTASLVPRIAVLPHTWQCEP